MNGPASTAAAASASAARVLAPPPARHADLLATLDAWVAQGWLRALDRVFAGFLAGQAPDADPLLILAAALASHQLGRGHACLDLTATLADASQSLALPPDDRVRRADECDGDGDGDGDAAAVLPPAALLAGVDLARWLRALDHAGLVGDGPGATPLVRQGARLYLRRYWQHEQDVRAAITQRAATLTQAARPGGEAALREAIRVVFTPPKGSPPPPVVVPDWQRLACALAARQGFAIVTGGPGTGKTTTVVRLLAVLQHLAMSGGDGLAGAAGGGDAARPLRIRLAAPTGKAAARLNESIAGAVKNLVLDGLGPNGDGERLRAAIPTAVTTVHRLLGSRPDSRHFRHHAGHPLPLDVLVVDEASMLDLEMMAAVLAALPPQARLILLGDKDQLASVEAGAVLGDLCRRADDGHYRPDTAEWLQAVTGEVIEDGLIDREGRDLDQAVAKLRHSHRFGADSGIGRLAKAVNEGDATAVKEVWASRPADLARLPAGDEAAFRALVVHGAPAAFGLKGAAAQDAPMTGYAHFLRCLHDGHPADDAPPEAFDAWARAVLAAQGSFQLLCALRHGPQGVDGLNTRVVALLRTEGLLPPGAGNAGGAGAAPEAGGTWYLGRPVLVTRNDYGLGLMNGDVGVTLARPDPARPGRRILRVAFPAGDGQGGIRWVLPSRLRAVETVFAMTVHKSQGSEFAHAALVLPERLSPVLTRELVYTGITRARRWFTLVPAVAATGVGDVLRAAVQRRVDRVSGLIDPG